ncbi:hypothetical protein B7486_51715 [cyanobacterium TDX16]|nr:hypothetical protein B7486_51715 [cyanobacterium TDX16]
MPKKQLYRNKDFIQIVINKEDKAAFDAWCVANSTTMSDIIRREIAPYIAQGQQMQQKAAT